MHIPYPIALSDVGCRFSDLAIRGPGAAAGRVVCARRDIIYGRSSMRDLFAIYV